jgi:3-hydroxyisobutyrate dehydrogenase-like beta-hydroxyacid dehydrogenase
MNTALLGLGLIGTTWAHNLQTDGIPLKTWNRTPKGLTGFEADPRRAVQDAAAIFIVVSDPTAVGSVLDAIVPALASGQTVIQSSTVSAEWTQKFAAQVAATGAAFLEAPFTGSKPAAEQRKTVFYTGGDPAVLENVRPLLARLSQEILHIGPLGSASTLKLAMNLNIAGIAMALFESLTLARSQGITDETFFAALRLNASRSGLSDLKEPKLKTRDFRPQFSVKHMDKDLRLVLETAGALSLPLARQIKESYEKGKAAGWADDDFIGLIRLLER